ncbi:MAG: acetyl-CoA acetyltransferase [Gammaproteobacteria bacterium]|nr:MAG: thiolase family protein [Pseudomonadota bacterium]MBC6944308.1 thiolase family protein [Gammaproteobacteria bacterium]MCE7897015.1 thiolase family protein [Gammaproteobacteria bacterium PRO8]MDL1879435.1 thiolase family protein [Gammaproteobacteria bacterium PRO2]MCL4777641.1 thiolase family protein [Gammaproteobacteria bacterium]
MSAESVVIVAARRTPIGAFQGSLAPVTTPQLGAAAIRACLADSGLQGADLHQALMGCVLQAGVGQAPARQAVLAAGLTNRLPTMTINKVCGSGLATVILGHDMIRTGSAGVVLAGGMESMSNAPYLLPKARAGYRMGHQQVLDHMFTDGLQNPYDGNMMGHFAEQTARKYGFTRAMQDAFATESVRRALAACNGAQFQTEIIPVAVKGRAGETLVDRDEEPFRADVTRIPTLKPAFAKDGTVTAASSSAISDGAAAVILMTAAEAARRGLEPLARIVGFSAHAHEPEWFTTAPTSAIRNLLERLGWRAGDVDLYEINEAFACVTMGSIHELELDPARVNAHGGACALGHPIGATGTRVLVTLVHALRRRGGGRGIASLCIGGGEALALAVEAS